MKTVNFITIAAIFFSVALVSCKGDEPCTETVWYEDSDGDGYGNPDVTTSACTQPESYVDNAEDIDDSDANLNPNSVWKGEKFTFTKASFTDWTLEENQDRITPNVWITRANKEGIFNIKTEPFYTDYESPDDTEWAFGTTDEINSLTFDTWENTHDSYPPSILNQNMVVHLISDNIYMDIKFVSWASGNGNEFPSGGGFSYERSTSNE